MDDDRIPGPTVQVNLDELIDLTYTLTTALRAISALCWVIARAIDPTMNTEDQGRVIALIELAQQESDDALEALNQWYNRVTGV